MKKLHLIRKLALKSDHKTTLLHRRYSTKNFLNQQLIPRMTPVNYNVILFKIGVKFMIIVTQWRLNTL